MSRGKAGRHAKSNGFRQTNAKNHWAPSRAWEGVFIYHDRAGFRWWRVGYQFRNHGIPVVDVIPAAACETLNQLPHTSRN